MLRRRLSSARDSMNRTVDLLQGRAYVIADLHGAWEPYTRYRDHFLALREQGWADVLILLGDVIHGYGAPEDDHSVPILLDIMRLQRELGPETVILLLGNHEMSHIYCTPLIKGDMVFMPRFEHALGEHRRTVTSFLKSLPFMVRTAGGILLVHAGASRLGALPENAERILNWSHEAVFEKVDRMLEGKDVTELIVKFGLADGDYDRQAQENLAVTGPDDPRYYDLLRGAIARSLEPEWSLLWDFFFTQCEADYGRLLYERVVDRFLEVYSLPGTAQRVLVSGHMVVSGGYDIPVGRNLRLASWTHARPNTEGRYLLLDVAEQVQQAADLEPYLHPLP